MSPKPYRMVGICIMLIGWSYTIYLGVGYLNQYSYLPGKTESGLNDWPKNSKLVRLQDGRPTLVLFAHPKCPCSRASIQVLRDLQSRTKGLAKLYVVFLRPEEWSVEEVQGELWNAAKQIPEVETVVDLKGIEALNFGVHTSGHVLLFDESGKKIFSGGITAARGEAGKSAGMLLISSYLQNREIRHVGQLPVFGCALTNK